MIIYHLMQSHKQIYTTEFTLSKIDEKHKDINFSLSKYADTLIIVINETGSIGSIVIYFLMQL